MNKEKVLFVLGSTGVGKSDLAIQIAIALGSEYNIQAELINADAIQVILFASTSNIRCLMD